MTGVVGFVGVGLGTGLMLTGLAPARPPALPWSRPAASPEALLRSLALTRAFAPAPPVPASPSAAPVPAA
ncbi:MAG: hypothetical protein ACRDZ4_04590, partial [Egibacteraceae bacterium]